jgi:hypothetical protein
MKTKVKFLVHESLEPNDPHDVFAYFPEETADQHNNKLSYAHIGQHSACHPDYAKESRAATPEEYKDLYNELVNSVGYDLEIV